jgi:hypothetical protein
VIIGGVAAFVLLGVVGYVAASSGDDEDTTSASEPAPAASTRAPASPEPTTSPSSRPEPAPSTTPAEPTRPDDLQAGPHLMYSLLSSPWRLDPAATNALNAVVAQTTVTEPNYRDGHDWLALAAVGPASPELYDRNDLAASAQEIATWFADNNFVGAEITSETRSRTPFEVDGRKAYLLEQHLSYHIEGLRSTGETVYVAVVDLGNGQGGMFIGSVPDTHPQLVKDVQDAIESLHVIE